MGYVNAAGMRMFEADGLKDLLGKTIYAFVPAADHEAMRERLRNLALRGNGGPYEQTWFTLKGKTLHTEIVETVTTLDNEPAIQVIIRDIPAAEAGHGLDGDPPPLCAGSRRARNR